MLKPQYLRVRNWEKFQHYKDRRPPWIKFHVELLDDLSLASLPLPTQLLYDRLLLWAARTDNNIEIHVSDDFPDDPQDFLSTSQDFSSFFWLSGKINMPAEVIYDGVQKLLCAGFLTLSDRKRSASKAIAKRKQSAMPETETETETEAETEVETSVAQLPAERAVRDVYDHWRTCRGKTDKRYDKISPARRQKIKARLAEFTSDELKRALDNVARDNWPDRHRHDDITKLFKSREAVDRWLDEFGKEQPGGSLGYTNYS